MPGSAKEGAPSLRIGQYWDTEAVPRYIAELSATFRDRNPEFDHRLFSEAETGRFIAERFGPREAAAFAACAVPSMQSDYFRYCYVLAEGGVYADVDYICARPLLPLMQALDGGEIFLGPDTHPLNGRTTRRVWSGFLAFRRPGHPFLRIALDIATANLEARISERVWPDGADTRTAIWLTVGPGIPTLMRFIHEWGSFETFLAEIVGTPGEPFGELYCEAIGSYERLLEAFRGVRASPHEDMLRWVRDAEDPLPYKRTASHWHNVRSAIFR